jgi:cytochrome c oxidase subunit 1
VLFASSLMGIFAGIYFWYPKMFGRLMNEPLGKVHFAITFIAGNCVFFPMHILGTAGLRRRIYEITNSSLEAPLLDINRFMTIAAFVLAAAQLVFIVNFFWSLFKGKVAGRNPWHSNSLEWSAPSPPPHGNFDVEPAVYRWPYDYGDFNDHGDYLPQTAKLSVEDAKTFHSHEH